MTHDIVFLVCGVYHHDIDIVSTSRGIVVLNFERVYEYGYK